MAKLDLPPTKSNLLTLRGSLDFAQEGFDLLEQKRQILIFELMSRLEAAKRAQKEVDEALAAAFAALREDALRSGTDALSRECLGIAASGHRRTEDDDEHGRKNEEHEREQHLDGKLGRAFADLHRPSHTLRLGLSAQHAHRAGAQLLCLVDRGGETSHTLHARSVR